MNISRGGLVICEKVNNTVLTSIKTIDITSSFIHIIMKLIKSQRRRKS